MSDVSNTKDTGGDERDHKPAPSEARVETPPEPAADPGHAMSIVELFDAGFGPLLVSVTKPGGEISPSSRLHPKTMGKAPGRLTQAGWTGVDLNSQKFLCHDRATAELWTDWGANAGFVVGDGYVALDNDVGEDLDRSMVAACMKVLGPTEQMRRFVRDPGHKRSLFLFRVLDFVGDPVAVPNRTLKFDRTGTKSEMQVLGQGKQFVLSGAHPGTGKPYVLNKRVTSLADIPKISPEQFEQIVEGAIAGMKTLGWALTSGGATSAGSKSAPGAKAKASAGPGAKASAGAGSEPPRSLSG